MPNRTVIVRLGVDASKAVAGLKKVTAEAKRTASVVKQAFADAKMKVDAGSSVNELRRVKTEAKAAAAASVAELKKIAREAKTTAAAGNALSTLKIKIDTTTTSGLRRITAAAKATADSVKGYLGDVKVRFNSSTVGGGLRSLVTQAKNAALAASVALSAVKAKVNATPAVREFKALTAVAKATGTAIKANVGLIKASVDANPAVAGLKKIVTAAKEAATGIKNGLSSTSSAVEKTGGSSRKLGGIISKAGLAGVAGFASMGAGIVGLGIGLGKSIQKASDFEASMRLVGQTTGDAGAGLKELTNLAIEMGAKTSFSAQGASDAMLALAKGGLTAAQIKAGALQSTLTLATAGGLELGEAANYMVQGLNTFSLGADQAGRVAASLAGAANASTADVSDLGYGLSQVGAIAKTAGLSIEDTTAALAAFSNQGIKSSDGGTSFKTFLQRLVPITFAASVAMEDYGLVTINAQKAFDYLSKAGVRGLTHDQDELNLKLKEYAMRITGNKSFNTQAAKEYLKIGRETGAMSNAFYDASGNIKSTAEIAGVLERALKGQTREQKIATTNILFGSDASRAAVALATEGEAKLRKYTQATSDKSAADRLAKSATEGFSGAMERFKGSIETAQIQLGTKFLPILSDLLDYLSGPAISTFQGIGEIIRDTFAPQLDKAQGGIRKFIEFLSTHQSVVIQAFKVMGNGVFDFGVAVAKMAAGGLRSIGDFTFAATRSVLGMVRAIIVAFDDIPGVDMSKTLAAFDKTADTARYAADSAKADLYGLADGIEKGVVPSIEKMRDRFNKSADTQIVKAEQRDALAKMGQSFKKVADLVGSGKGQIDSYAEAVSALGDNSSKLSKALGSAKSAFEKQYDSAKKTGAKQAELNEITKGYKDQLLDTLTQMTGNRKEAEKLAEKYGLMPSKLVTDAEFEYKTAKASAKAYREYVNEEHKKVKVLSEAKWNATKAKKDSRSYREYVNDEQKKHKVLSKAEWDARVAKGSSKAYREYVNAEQKKHKVLSKAQWDATKAKNDDRTYREYVNDQQRKHKVLSKAEWDAREAKSDALSFRKYVNDQVDRITKNKTVNIKYDTNASALARKWGIKLKGETGGGVPNNKDGGTIARGPGRGGPRDDKVLGLDPATGSPTTWISPDEEVVKAKSAGPNRAVLKQINAGDGKRFDVIPRNADGGTVRKKIKIDTDQDRAIPDFNEVTSKVSRGIKSKAAPIIGRKLAKAAASFEAALAAAAENYSSGGAAAGFSASQMRNAATIASVGSGMGKRAQQIGIATAIVESGLRNLSGGDRDSVGLFQQRAPWGPFSARHNPRISAGMFFHGGRGGQRGLDDIPGWKSMDRGRAAQKVQVSAFPGRYAQVMGRAENALAALSSSGGGGGGGKGKGGRHWPTTGRIVTTYPGHDGIDINARGNDHGNPIYAYRSGRITYTGYGHGYGNAVFEQPDVGASVVYGHGSKVLVKKGQRVQVGQIIARVGSTGHSTGDHLHFGHPGGTASQARAMLRGLAKGGTVPIKATKYDKGGTLQPGLGLHYNGTRKPEQVITDARWQQLVNSRSQPARIDSADMARLVEAISRQVPAQLTINNPVREPSSRSIATASNYAGR